MLVSKVSNVDINVTKSNRYYKNKSSNTIRRSYHTNVRLNYPPKYNNIKIIEYLKYRKSFLKVHNNINKKDFEKQALSSIYSHIENLNSKVDF